MARELVGHDVAIERLALLGVRHLARELVPPAAPLRALIVGPAGSGKSLLLKTFMDSLGLPHVLIPAQTLAEMNWSGSDLGDFLGRLYDGVHTSRTPFRTAALVERAVVVLDGLDALRLPGRYGSASTRDYQLGRQQSLIPLLGSGIVPIERSRGAIHWPSVDALVIACGVFAGLPDRVPSAEDLTDWGVIPELSDRLSTGTILRLAAPAQVHMPEILDRSLESQKQAFALFGYELEVAPEALSFVTSRVADAAAVTGVRAAVGWLSETAERVLAAMIQNRVPPGTKHTLAPDDLRVPPASRGIWRE